ncbi:fibrillin-1-like [Cebidichthys violaceus]|uniref:fibrillin-1-like n=1 Tax=Cebidichthys violaceus TaxID=271503 RepID=UPI0035C94F1B
MEAIEVTPVDPLLSVQVLEAVSVFLDIDECQRTAGICGPNAKCSNTIGSYICTCLDGYKVADPASPPGTSNKCADIDECLDNVCGDDGTCQNNIGSYVCECHEGYQLVPDATPVCQDIDECFNSTVCGPESVCTNTPGAYACKCELGYAPTEPDQEPSETNICIDVDECDKYATICGPDANCTNSIGSYTCTCFPGFRLNNPGVIASIANPCTDIDECSETPGLCGKLTVCTNVPGTFYCSCPDGFYPSTGLFWEMGVTYCQSLQDILDEIKPPEGQTKERAFLGNMDQQLKDNEGIVLPEATVTNSFSASMEVSGVGPRSRSNKVSSEGDGETGSVILGISDRLVSAIVQPGQNQTKRAVRTSTVDLSLETIGPGSNNAESSLISAKGNTMQINLEGLAKNNNGSAAAAFMTLNGMESLLSHQYFKTENRTEMYSDVITAILPAMNNTNLTEPVNFTIQHKKTVPESGLVTCVYWEDKAEEGEGSETGGKKTKTMRWSVEGCWVAYTNENYTVCSCSHLSTFALIMQIGEPPPEDPFLEWLNRMCVIVGLFFLALAIFTFLLCSWNPKINNTARLHLCLSLFFSHLLLLWNDEYVEQELACTVMAGLLHFVVIASFVWMLLEALQLHLLVRRLSKVQVIQRDGLPRPLLYLIGYGVPFVIVGISALVYSDGYGATEAEVCWLSRQRSFNWALTGPVIVILGLNWILFCATLWSLRPTLASMKSDVSQSKDTRLIVFKILAQFVILGCTWILGLYQTNLFFQVLFIILNSQQGTFLFIVHCLLNKEVREEYVKWLTCSFNKRKEGGSVKDAPSVSEDMAEDQTVLYDCIIIIVFHLCLDHHTCNPDSCGPLAECLAKGGCACVSGYEIPPKHLPTQDSYGCVDIDECQRTAGICGPNAKCSNTIGSYICTCLDGYKAADPASPPGTSNKCADIDECLDNVCGDDGTCQNNIGSYVCECHEGYQLVPDATPVCQDIDECFNSTVCVPESVCTNTPGAYACKCELGYAPTEPDQEPSETNICIDVDECDKYATICGPDANCTNSIGSYTCTCFPGFRLNNPGVIASTANPCPDIDECSETPGLCGKLTVCTNVPGTFYCSCPDGFFPSTGLFWEMGVTYCESLQDILDAIEPPEGQTKERAFLGNMDEHLKNNPGVILPEATVTNGLSACMEVSGVGPLAKSVGLSSEGDGETGSVILGISDRLVSSMMSPNQTRKSVQTSTVDLSLQAIGPGSHHDNKAPLSAKGQTMEINLEALASANNGSAAAAFMTLNGMESLLSHQYFKTENQTEMYSDVFTAILPSINNTNLTEPVNFTIQHKKIPESGIVTCVYWEDESKNKGEGANEGETMRWSVEGCWVAYSNENYTVCSCSHLSTFALIMQIGEPPPEDPFLEWLNRMCVIVGLFFLALAIFTFLLCSWNPKINNTARLHLCLSLFFSHLLLLWNDEYVEQELACTVMAGLLHFVVIASFVWMLLEALQLHLLVRRLSKVQVIQRDGLPRPLLYLIGYGVPFVIVGISALVYSDGYGATEAEVCWLSRQRSFNWALTGPVIVILGLNWILFCATLWSLRPTLANMKSDVSQSKDTRLIVFKILAQFVILGCTWILGLYQTNLFFQVLFIILNSQQGTFLFIVHCLLNKEVREEYIRWLTGSCGKDRSVKDVPSVSEDLDKPEGQTDEGNKEKSC